MFNCWLPQGYKEFQSFFRETLLMAILIVCANLAGRLIRAYVKSQAGWVGSEVDLGYLEIDLPSAGHDLRQVSEIRGTLTKAVTEALDEAHREEQRAARTRYRFSA